MNEVKIKFFPFQSINAITDIDGKTIYLSSKINPNELKNIMMDEYGHIVSDNPLHGEEWEKACIKLYGSVPIFCHSAPIFTHLYETNESYEFYRCVGRASKMGCNIGNITGIQNLLLDFHLLQAYRKFSQHILGTSGSWEVTGDNMVHLKPTPKGAFPVVFRYLPSVDEFVQPVHREVTMRALISQCKIMLGHTRRKMSVPSPDGGTITMDGEALVTEGAAEYAKACEDAVLLGEPLGFIAK